MRISLIINVQNTRKFEFSVKEPKNLTSNV